MYSEKSFNNHQVFKTIDTLSNTTQKLLDDDSIVDNKRETIQRIKENGKYFDRALDNVDPYYTPLNILKNINTQLQNANNQLNNFNNNNSNHLNSANNHIENALVQLSNIPFSTDKVDANEFVENIRSFRQSSGQYLRYLEEDYKDLKEKYGKLSSEFQNLKKEIGEQKSRLDNSISNYQNQFSEAEGQRREQFQKAENERSEKFNSQITTYQEKLSSKIEDFDTKAKEKIKSISDSTTDIIAKLREHKNEAEELVNVVANIGMSGGFQKVADQARKTKIFWQATAIISILGLIGFSFFAFQETVTGEFDFRNFGARSFVAISFGVLAAYSARQANKNAVFERRNRQLELEFASIDMYLAKLPEEDQQEIKKNLSDKWFGNLPMKEQKNNSREGTSYDLLKMMLENMTKNS